MNDITGTILALVISLGSAYLIWYYIYGRRELIGGRNKVFKDLILPFIPASIAAVTITFDFYNAVSFTEEYSSLPWIPTLLKAAGALITLFVIIPAARHFSGKDAVVPETAAIFAPFLLTLTLNFLISSLIYERSYISYPLCYLSAGVLSSLAVICTPLISQQQYNKGLLKISEQLSESRNAHYEALTRSNFEIRRTRHDMKNHLLVIRDLAESGRKDELLSYIDSIIEKTDSAKAPYRSGNDIADMIIADKVSKADKRGLNISISGDLSGLKTEPSDLVTILSNLLDNAIEAVSRLYGQDLTASEKTIELEFKKNANFLVIVQKNISLNDVSPGRIISSKNSPDHGFGIYNIKKTVSKYGGEYDISSQETGSLYRVTTQIILPMT